MELAAQCEARGLDLHLDWVPREVNAEADSLADGDSSGFAAANRVHCEFDRIPWLVLDGLLAEGHRFFKKGVGSTPPAPSGARQPGRKRLRESEPW